MSGLRAQAMRAFQQAPAEVLQQTAQERIMDDSGMYKVFCFSSDMLGPPGGGLVAPTGRGELTRVPGPAGSSQHL